MLALCHGCYCGLCATVDQVSCPGGGEDGTPGSFLSILLVPHSPESCSGSHGETRTGVGILTTGTAIPTVSI